MIIPKEWRRPVEDTRVYRDADVASDPYLRNLESYRQTADDPCQNTYHEIREEKKQATT